MNVLIVDDEKLIMEDLKVEVLSLFPDAMIEGTTSAVDAIKYSQKTEFDVALLDIDMPEMNGLTLARKLIADCPTINIIFITGYKEYSLEAHELYCSSFLVKPVGSRKLKKAFDNLRKPFLNLPPGFSNEHYSGGALIGTKLKQYREQRGISRQELADYMNVTRQTIFRWESGERVPDILTFLKLARLLGVSIEDIIK